MQFKTWSAEKIFSLSPIKSPNFYSIINESDNTLLWTFHLRKPPPLDGDLIEGFFKVIEWLEICFQREEYAKADGRFCISVPSACANKEKRCEFYDVFFLSIFMVLQLNSEYNEPSRNPTHEKKYKLHAKIFMVQDLPCT